MSDDVSDYMTKQAKLEAELQSLRTVLDEVGAYVYMKDRTGRYTFVNRYVLELFNRRFDEVVGHDDSQFFDLAKSDELRANDRQVMEQGQTIQREELNYIKPSGEQRTYWTVKKPVYGADGSIIGMCGISTDITDRKRLEKELARQRQLLETALNNVDAFVYIRDTDHRFLYVNQKLVQLFGLPAEKILGHTVEELLPAGSQCNFTELDNQVFSTGMRQAGQEQLTDAHGHSQHYWSIKVPIDIEHSSRTLIGFSTEITELHTLQEELKRLSNTDALTHLHNRRAFLDLAEREFSRTVRHTLPLALLVLDVDLFKQINDQFGHPAGDNVLQAIADRIRASVRKEDLPARVGGEEFAVMLPETDRVRAEALAERIRHAIADSAFSVGDGKAIAVTISIGLTTIDPHDDEFAKMYSRADRALYAAKEAGRNCVREA